MFGYILILIGVSSIVDVMIKGMQITKSGRNQWICEVDPGRSGVLRGVRRQLAAGQHQRRVRLARRIDGDLLA
jgi:hypothetical protein